MNTEAHTADLREYLRVLRARKYEVGLVTFVLVLATLFFSFRQTPIYEGDARILVKPVQNPNNLSLSQAPNLETERELILSQVVARSVQQQLHLTTPVDGLLRHVGVQVVTDTEVLVVKYQDPSPAVAAKLANGFASAYVDFRSQQALTQF